MIILIALAAATAQSVVTAADPTSQFKGDGIVLKMDPSCRDYTLDSVTTDPACAARIAKAEPAPSLAIATHTIMETPVRRADAIALLERSAKASDSPAVHYLLGNLLASPSIMRPDYSRAVGHLSIAASRGNPAAADLLASLILDGKGAHRDVPRAIKLYETAAANGFPSAAVSLGRLYLMGRYGPIDEIRGRAWLDAATAVGAPSAAQLAPLASGISKTHNFQLMPAADPKSVRTVEFGPFDNPDIPPNFGFDTAFQKVHAIEFDDAATRTMLVSQAHTMPTPYLYELARRLAPLDPARATKTYLIARMRMAYDASRCADPAAMEALRAWDMLVGGDIRFLFSDGPPSKTIVLEALADEAQMPSDTQPWWVCRSGMAEMTAAMGGKVGPLKLKPAVEWPALRETARSKISALAGK